jgi:hypothetical protein
MVVTTYMPSGVHRTSPWQIPSKKKNMIKTAGKSLVGKMKLDNLLL